MDYGKTLNLPKTDFPMRAKLPQREPEIMEIWEQKEVYHQLRKKRQGATKFVLHDGPPYANGAIHMGTALNKVLKDIIVKFRAMEGYDAPYVPGWDTHGLPIEHQIIKTKNIQREEVSDLDFRRMCRDYALHYVDVQRDQFKRLGVRGDWEEPYLTLAPSFEAKQIEVFGIMADQGYIYKGLKPVYWCADCQTALAEAEVEYQDRRSDSIFVKFPITEDKGLLSQGNHLYCLIWTTTPWTIPANQAVAVHPDFSYVLAETTGGSLLVAEGLLEELQKMGNETFKVLARFSGKELEGIRCKHPLYQREAPLILSRHVTLGQGTGCVHIAPGHGHEDFELGEEYQLEVMNPLDDQGYFTREAGRFSGLRYQEGNKAVIDSLQEDGLLWYSEEVEHQYPHCWRCKQPILFRATEQWFASVEGFREQALTAVEEVNWIPAWGKERMKNMVAERQDWCISRQRVWGVPLPVFYCQHCATPLLNRESVKAVQELFAKEGSDAWFYKNAEEILPPDMACTCCGGQHFYQEKDIMDVWFDSGSSHVAVCEVREDQHWPADLYLEGSDQFRGWFQSSLLTSVATRSKPPYNSVLSHGWVVDGEGRKMSKSLGNVISPEEIIKKYGADILRLWVSSADFTRDVHLSESILQQLVEVYRKIRNTSKFMLGNLNDFSPEKDTRPYQQWEEIDKWAYARLQQVLEKVTLAYKSYEYHQVFHTVHHFCVVDLSNFYLDVIKDRLYCSLPEDESRRSAQTVIYHVLKELMLMLAPVISFTTEEVWQKLPGDKEESIQLSDWPLVRQEFKDEELLERWKKLLDIRDEIMKALEQARQEKVIGGSLEAKVILYAEEPGWSLLKYFDEQLSDLMMVSQHSLIQGRSGESNIYQSEELPLEVKVEKAEGDKCERCWNFTPELDSSNICPRCNEVLAQLEKS